MITAAVAFFVALMVSVGGTPILRSLARKRGWVDVASSTRKVHAKAIPRIGGVAIGVAFIAPLVGLLCVDSSVGRMFAANRQHVLAMLLGGVFISAVGLLDDLRGLGAVRKLLAQCLIAGLAVALGIRVEYVSSPWGAMPLGAFSVPLTILWIVAVVNAMNLIDGLDGLASGVAFVAVATNFVIAAVNGNALMMLFMAALGGAIIGFLVFNFNPASIFMGDSGSLFLGYVLAIGTIVTNTKASATVALLAPVLALGLPIMDTALAVYRRAVAGRPLFAADREHVHHRMLAMGFSHRRAVIVLYLVALLLAGLGLLSVFANQAQTAGVLCLSILVGGVFVRKLGYGSEVLEQSRATRAHNRDLRSDLAAVCENLRRAAAPVDAWNAIERVKGTLGVSELSLSFHLASAAGELETQRFEWRRGGGEGECVALALRFGGTQSCSGELAVVWRDGRRAVNRSDEIALESLREWLEQANRTISRAGA